MKKIVLVCILINICSLFFSENQISVNITLKLTPIYGGGQIEIYNGSYSRVSHIIKKINSAREISSKNLIKEALIEGEYIIVLKEKDSYIVINSENIYSERQDKYFVCRIIDDISRLLILHLLENRANK